MKKAQRWGVSCVKRMTGGGYLPAALRCGRRRIDPGHAGSALRREGTLLRSAAAHEGAGRLLPHRRLRSAVREPKRPVEQVDRAHGKPGRLHEVALGSQFLHSVRRDRDLCHQPES